MIDVPQKKEKIVSFLSTNGPSLPVRIAKEIDMSPVFASAILSELLHAKKVKLSNLKIGSSPLYFLPGQEEQLENFTEHLKGVEKEAFLLLKEKSVLSEDSLEPAIRVALQSIKDFAKQSQENQKTVWKYIFAKDAKELPKQSQVKEETQSKETKKDPRIAREQKIEKKSIEKIMPAPKSEKVVQTSHLELDFEKMVLSFIENKGFVFLEKIQSDKKEFIAKVNLLTKIGDINFLLIAKNKRTTTKDEIHSAIQRADYEKMPCIYLTRKEPPKNVQEAVKEHTNRFKILVLE